MPADKEEEIMELRRMFHVGGLFHMVDHFTIDLHARNSSGASLSLCKVIFKVASSSYIQEFWVLPWTSPL